MNPSSTAMVQSAASAVRNAIPAVAQCTLTAVFRTDQPQHRILATLRMGFLMANTSDGLLPCGGEAGYTKHVSFSQYSVYAKPGRWCVAYHDGRSNITEVFPVPSTYSCQVSLWYGGYVECTPIVKEAVQVRSAVVVLFIFLTCVTYPLSLCVRCVVFGLGFRLTPLQMPSRPCLPSTTHRFSHLSSVLTITQRLFWMLRIAVF